VRIFQEKWKIGNKIVDFLGLMGRISIVIAILESVHYADQFEYNVDNAWNGSEEKTF